MKHNINPMLKKVPVTPKKSDLSAVPMKWLFGKKKTIWDYLKDTSIDESLRETVYYFMYAALVIIKAYENDPAWADTIRYINYVYSMTMDNFEKKNYSGIKRLVSDEYIQKLVDYGRKWAKQDGKIFPW